jgi:diguanylate cyclase (GGDEF)-like protein
MLACAATCLTFAAFPPNPETPRSFDLLMGLVAVTLAVLEVTLLPHVPDGWGLDVGLGVAVALSAVGAFWMPRAQGQLLIGFGLVLMGVYAAYFRPRRRLVGLLIFMLAAYGAALLLTPRLPSPLFFLVVAGTVVGVALLISSMAGRMRDLAFRDGLTGVLNRRGFDVATAPVAGMVARAGTQVTVGLIDLDNFKAYNDAHGHLAGDDFLVELTSAWSTGLRRGDLMARVGGDEFALVLPDSSPAVAYDLAERLRALHPGAWSVGFTEWRPGEDVTEALTRADLELYADKRRRADA